MITEKTYEPNLSVTITDKLKDYIQLGKLRLSLVVVFSAGMSFLIGSQSAIDWKMFFVLVAGGLLITVAANALNEIIETKYDALMPRTSNRPLPMGRMSAQEALIFAILTGIGGVIILYFAFNPLCGLMGLASLLLYAFVYTPLKRVGSIAVWVGAVPGALPNIIGYVAASHGDFDLTAGLLFAIQFFWQLPHFWSIAWLADEDYRKAGYRLLPFSGERNQFSAVIICFSAIVLMPVGYLPFHFGLINLASAITIFVTGIVFFAPSLLLIKNLNRQAALLLMFGSFLYLPAVQIAFLLGKL